MGLQRKEAQRYTLRFQVAEVELFWEWLGVEEAEVGYITRWRNWSGRPQRKGKVCNDKPEEQAGFRPHLCGMYDLGSSPGLQVGAEGGELLSQEKARFQVGPREGESIKRRLEDGKAQAPEIRWKKTRRGGIYGVYGGSAKTALCCRQAT